MREHPARELWGRLEPIHAVTYFSPECRGANADVGLRGFWMGYFGARAAPLGPVGPGVVEAACFNFAPRMVRRAIPDAWEFASPARILEARRLAAAEALRRQCPAIDDIAATSAPILHRAVDAAVDAGRVLFAANRDLAAPTDSVERLWWLATCLREHRGDGHVAILTAECLDGCEAHVLFAADTGVPAALLRDNRGWTTEEWGGATERLVGRGLLDGEDVTPLGRALHHTIETRTDELAMSALGVIEDDLEHLVDSLHPAALAITASGELPFPNPIGLPALVST